MSNMDVYRQMNEPEMVEVKAEEIAAKSAEHEKKRIEAESVNFLEEFYNMSSRKVKRKLKPAQKFGNTLLKAYQAKNKK